MTELITFEMILYFQGELNGSIDELKKEIERALIKYIDQLDDIELRCIKSERKT